MIGPSVTPKWRAGFGYEFMERPDGYKGMAATYGLRFAPRFRRLEGQRKRLWGKSEVP